MKAGVFVDRMADGSPTKEFFVGMLTRDIELSDAILDLLDNCLDGVVRQKKHIDKYSESNYYSGYYSHITISDNRFIIEDNCGGIPLEVAEKYAFRMGRSSDKDDDLPTVGIYGIGMKRAIFKIGRSARVITRNGDAIYKVTIPKGWASSEDAWNFPIENLNNTKELDGGGTRIEIEHINNGIAENWNTQDKMKDFIDRLIKAIEQSYSFIIQKGFQIKINGEKVSALPIHLLMAHNEGGEAIQPFLYKKDFDDVHVSLAVGFYAPPPSPEDIDDENNLKRSSSDAGWTIVCNDRVVLYNDKSHLTGWGEAGVPQYHTQFIGIRGIVIFESSNPKNLPMTTTKRGIDTSSDIYAAVKNQMRQGLKLFTDYTNRWKGQNNKEREYSKAAQRIEIKTLTGSKEEVERTNLVKFHSNNGALVFKPKLPKPPNDKPYRIISFSRGIEEIRDIIEYFYDDRTHPITPSQIGEKCFDFVLKKAHDKKDE
ncbi:ATP-binding protein [Segatella oulorum]|uniref:ATP-binding protein n=1 Tax=Segatella oulorum TaxID=28136 RepID=UPI0023F31982|nr:ATP-binding protein [Segatella oulorum]